MHQRFTVSLSIVVALLTTACIFNSNILHAQPANAGSGAQVSVANEFRYGIGKQFESTLEKRKEYLENMLNARVYVGDFTLGFRAEIDKPREVGRDTIGLTQYYAEFHRDGIRARAGTFYNLVGRGLTFNTIESRPLGFNTQAEGIKVDYESPVFSADGFGGILNYTDITTFSRTEEYLVRGANGDVRPMDGLAFGGSYIQASGRQTKGGFFKPFDAFLREASVTANTSGFTAYVNYADKRTQIDSADRAITSSNQYGYGWLASLGYKNASLGITAEMKDYRFDPVDPSELQNGTRKTRALPFQMPPTLLPEYDKTLLARNPHAIDYSDELGMQLEALVFPAEGLQLTVVGSVASRHNAWVAVDDSGRTAYVRQNEQPASIAKFSDPMYSPFWEFYAQGEYEVNDDLTFTAGIQRRDNTIYDEGTRSTLPHASEYKATTLMLESMIGLSSNNSLHAILELQRVYDSKTKAVQNDSLGIVGFDGVFSNALVTLEYSSSPRWSANVRFEVTTTDVEQGGQHIWPVVGGTYRIGGAHTLNAQYGAERGGVVCTGGVCRLINPFTGFRISLISKL